MSEITQAVLLIVITVITALLVMVGTQVYNILKEIRETIRKVNKILDDAGSVSESISKPISSVADVLTGATGITGLLGWLINRKKKKEEKDA
jgi:hypothetical protein